MYDAPEEIRDCSVKGKYRIPMNMHIGNMGLAPAVGAAVTTGPPYRTGGNLDNKRIGVGGMPFMQHSSVTMAWPCFKDGCLRALLLNSIKHCKNM